MSITNNNIGGQFFNKNSLGVIRQRTNKFLEFRKKITEENSSVNSFHSSSSLNDNGKTR